MRDTITAERQPQTEEAPCFEVLAPQAWTMPAVFNSAHSGIIMPQRFLNQTRLTLTELRQSEDCYVDELFSGCLDHHAPMLRALVSRAYVDLNREPFELDQRMFIETLPSFMNTASSRVAAGFGTLPRLVGDGLEIYRGKIKLEEAVARVEACYKPYHRTLNALLHEAQEAAGSVLLIDCHSMPSSAVKSGPRTAVDIVLGDRFGMSCATDLSHAIETFFVAQGLSVSRNRPYAGAFITETYGAPQQNRHAIQIEINRALYMNERNQEKTEGFTPLKNAMTGFAAYLDELLEEFTRADTQKLAAE